MTEKECSELKTCDKAWCDSGCPKGTKRNPIVPVLVGSHTYFTREILSEMKGATDDETIARILHYLEFMLRIDAQMGA